MIVEEENPIGLETHGLGQNLLWEDHGLSPYWGVVSVFEPDHDETLGPFEACGETWEIVGAKHWNGQLAHPENPDEFEDGLYEYQYKLEAVDDWGDRDAVFQFRPGFPDAMNVHSGNPIQSMPDDCPESIRVQSITTNLSVDESLELLQALADHIGLNPDYFHENPHPYSSIYQFERYGRLDRAVAQDHLTGSGGIIDEIADFAKDQRGRGEYKWDHEEIEGHYQSVAIDPDTWDLLLEDQSYGKHFKCYHPFHVRSESTDRDDDPLADPKIEMSYSSEYHPGESLDWHERDEVVSELDEAVHNILYWADVPVTPDADVWTDEDPYFDGNAGDAVELVSNPLPDLRDATEHHVESEFVRADVTDTDLEIAKVLTDGGNQHYEELAENADASTSAVYRLLDKFSALLESDNGIVKFIDDATRQHATDILEQVRETTEWAGDAIREVVDRDSLLRGEGTSALEKWMQRHGIKLVNSQRDRIRLKLGRRVGERELMKILRSGLEAAEGSGIPTEKIRNGLIDWVDRDGNPRKGWQIVVDGSILRKGGGDPYDSVSFTGTPDGNVNKSG
ncbi:DUF7845 domain-containing protein [Halomicrobium urmianum]|uniref:DUF7845 domain-containing protein n=1 Tax=Halomicrobium urmianum TaxID=1586233 RepID=UPI001CD9C632|nr:hypothetical protein [Halomicrobium urmianum]